MARVKMITRLAGPEGIIQPGTVWDVPETMACELVAAGYAEWVEEAGLGPGNPGVETAEAVPAPERAVSRRGKKRRGEVR